MSRPAALRAVGPLALLLTAAAPVAAQVQVFAGARVLPVTAPPIESGVLVVEDGRIVAVGAEGEVEIPAGAVVRRLAGRTIVPGLVDSHSHVADVSGGDGSEPLQPAVRALDGVDFRADTIGKARAGGITTVNVMPGSGLRLAGQTVYLKLRASGSRVEDWLLCPRAGICGGMKMANGTNSLRDRGEFPRTRGRSAALARGLFVRALDHRGKRERTAGDPAKAPARDLGLEAVLELLDGRRVVHHHTHRADDIETVLRLAEEFGFRVVLHHVSDGWTIADRIAAAPVLGVSINVMDAPGGKHENAGRRLETPAILDRAGVAVAISTDDSVTDSRFLLRSAALAVRGGLPEETALEAVTIVPARMLDLEARIGSLEPGKDADFAILSGAPFSAWTRVEETWVEGEQVFDRTGETGRFQAGGYRVYRERESGLAHLDSCD
jgi:imidazolonepropionase-like amidohydrolase